MPITTLSAEYGIYKPKDLAFLKGVFDEVKRSHKLAEPWQSSALARQILYIYRTGVSDRVLLLKALDGSYNYQKPRRSGARVQLHKSWQRQFAEGDVGPITSSIM